MKAFFSIILAFAISVGTIQAGPVRTAKNVAKSSAITAKNVAHSVVKGKKSRAHCGLYTHAIGPGSSYNGSNSPAW